jgi:SulP family sulfate permease
VPGSLVGILAATGLTIALGWQVPIIGAIPRTILLAERLQISTIPWERLPDLVVPAMSIAALGAIESLLCGAVAGNMTGIRMANSVELAAQGIGNLLIPFFGGVPATAAIARTSVNVKSGGVTRMTSILHGVALLLVTYLLAPWMRAIPLSALAGVLMITAWRMNEWAAIQFYFGRRLRHAMAAFILTLAATVLLDLTQAIMIGFGISTLIFMAQISDLDIVREPVIADRLGANGRDYTHPEHPLAVYYVSGPMFFAAVRKLTDTVEQQDPANTTLILSLRGVPLIDATGVEVLRELIARQHEGQGRVLLAGLQPKVRMILERAGLLEEIGSDNIFWSSDRAILSLGGAAQAGEPEFGSSKLNDLDQAAQITPHENRKL